MFSGCTSLTQAPTLPATALANYCYQSMFYNCTSLKLSSTKTDEYTQEYRIPSSGNGTTATDALTDMFTSTGGTFTGTPEINTIYYLSSDNMIVRGSELANLNGYVKTMIDAAVDIPTTLPNPNALTFTGAVNATYDGQTAVSVEIPSGGTDISLGLASAAVGQIPKIKAVDSNGVPTEWEPATLSGSSSDYVINVTLDTLQSSIGNWILGYSCTCDKTYAEVLAAYQSGAKVIAHVIRNKEITLSDGSKRTIPIINEAPLTRYIAAQNLLVFDYVHNATDLSVSSGGLTYTTGDSMICYVATYQFAFGAADTSADSVQIPTTTKVQDMIDTSVSDINTNTYTIQVSNTAPAAGTSDKIITYVVEDATAQ